MTPEEVDALIAKAEELKTARMRETHFRAVVLMVGSLSRNPKLRDRYFIVNVPKDFGEERSRINNARNYVHSKERFPLLYEMVVSGNYDSPSITTILYDSTEPLIEIS